MAAGRGNWPSRERIFALTRSIHCYCRIFMCKRSARHATKAVARQVIGQVVEELVKRLGSRTQDPSGFVGLNDGAGS